MYRKNATKLPAQPRGQPVCLKKNLNACQQVEFISPYLLKENNVDTYYLLYMQCMYYIHSIIMILQI